jgi:hypothetical protein
MKKWAQQIAEALRRLDLDHNDRCVFGGLGSVGVGLWLVYPPAAFIVVGAFFVALGLRGAK